MNGTIKIGLAEDHVFVRQGIIALLANVEKIEVLFDVNNGQELLSALEVQQPDIILLDIEMPVMSGWEAIVQIQNKYPLIRVIMLSMHFTDELVSQFVTLGAKAFIYKQVDIRKIISAITGVFEKGYYYDEVVADILARSILTNKKSVHRNTIELDLTKREQQVLELLKEHKTTSVIADKLNLSRRTVEGHRQHLLQKAGVNSTEELLKLVIRISPLN